MKTSWKINWIFVSLLILGMWFSYSQNMNTLGIMSPTQTPLISAGVLHNVYTWRYFCPVELSVMAIYGGWGGFGNCQYSLKFEPTQINLEYLNRWSAFAQTDNAIITGNQNILFVEEKNWRAITGTVECSRIRATGYPPQDIVDIHFVRANWDLPIIPSDFETTMPDILNLAWGGNDTLTWIQNIKLSLFACPCILDNEQPKISNWMIWGEQFDNTAHYQWPQTVKFLVYDKWWSSRSYWTQWTKNLSNYTWWAPAWMDNQEWINSGTIVVKIYSWDDLIQTLSYWEDALTITEYLWSTNTPKYTWDGNIRWYWVSFDTTNLPVETPLKIEVTVKDNSLDNGGDCTKNAKKTTDYIILNEKQSPVITFNRPTGSNVNPNTWVKLTVSDNRAWVDTGSLVVEILPVFSWWQMIMTWSIYSWSDLTFVLTGGSEWLGWASKYEVTFQPIYQFPVDSTITLSGYVKDLVGMTGQQVYTFHTRKDCTFYGCVNFVDIFSGSLSNLIQPQFTWSLIVVTGTILPYPYLTWLSEDIVMCWPIDWSIKLDWNIDIYSGNEIFNWNVYPYWELYVTGLDFEYQSGVIVPIY